MISLVLDHSFAFNQAPAPSTVGPMVLTAELRRLLQNWYDLKGDRPLSRRADPALADLFAADRSVRRVFDWLAGVPEQDR